MTILDAQNILISYFLENDILKLSDYKSIFLLLGDDTDLYKDIIIFALSKLEEENIIKGFLHGNEKYYVLNKPIQSYNQQVTLHSDTCNLIGEIINDYCDSLKDKDNICDKLNITDKDIKNILQLLINFTNKNNE